MKIMYQSNDGMLFETEEECILYENDVDTMLNVVDKIRIMCASLEDCENCPFYGEHGCCLHGCPQDWDTKVD